MRPRRPRLLLSGLVAGLALAAFVTFGLPGTAASAVIATGHAVGYQSADGYWIGSYRLADGSTGFCVNLGRSAPTGNDFSVVNVADLGWYSTDDSARLAYIARTWGGTTDADTAAAAQLATWTITGLDGRTVEDLAGRAGARASAVKAQSDAMLEQIAGDAATGGASREVGSRLAITRSAPGVDSVRADLDVDFLSGPRTVPPRTHRGLLVLDGAVFADGSDRQQVENGVDYPIRPTGTAAVSRMSARIAFDSLPYGIGAVIAHNPGDVQNLLLGTPASAATSTSAAVERPTSVPFQPAVATRTSRAVAVVGASISDHLTVSVRGAEGTSPEWAVTGPDGGPYQPIPILVHSALLGPFPIPPLEADRPPDGAPRVCEVTTRVESGPGEYDTDPCVLPSPGYYVWTESIDGDRTGADQTAGGDSPVLHWNGRFGLAEETTTVAAPAAPVAAVPERLAATGGSGLSPAAVMTATTAFLAIAGGVSLLGRRSRTHRANRARC